MNRRAVVRFETTELLLMTNIIVLVKQVPDTNAKIIVNNGRVDLSAVKMVFSFMKLCF